MTHKLLVSAVLPACIAFHIAALPIPAAGQDLFGAVGGVTRDSASRQPLAQVRITAHNLKRGTDRTATSGSDGTFTVQGLEPGLYDVAASRDGFADSTAKVEVAMPGTRRVDFLLAADNSAVPRAKASPAAADAAVTAVEEELTALKQRISQLEAALHARSATAQPPTEATSPAETAKAAAPDSGAPVASATAASMPTPATAPQQPSAAPPAFVPSPLGHSR